VIAGVRLHPVLVVLGALAENLFIHYRQAEDLVEEKDHLLGPRQTTEVAMDDDAVETVIDEHEQPLEQLGE
jgi:hypothetical protein